MDSGSKSFTNMRHFVGVVEDRNDPMFLGRLKVRIYSVHTDDKGLLPTEKLPWALVLQPITSPAISGIGRSPTGVVEGTWVFGVFLDEGEYQQPLVMGSLAGNPSEEPNPGKGFHDPNGVYPKDDPGLSSLYESSVDRHARGEDAESHDLLIEKRKNKDEFGVVESAKGSKIESVLANKDDKYYEPTAWKEPHPRFGGQDDDYPEDHIQSAYPLNHTWYTEGGHLFEVDDTPDGERIHMLHSSGTLQEIQPDGNRVTKINGTDYEITLKDKDVYIRGNVNVTIDGDARLLIKGDKVEEIGGNYFLTVVGDYVKKVQGNEAKEIISDKSTQINGNKRERVSKNKDEITVGNFTESIGGKHDETINKEETVTNLDSSKRTCANNVTWLVAENIDIGAGNNVAIAAAEKMTIKSINDMKIETENNQLINVVKTQTITANTQDIDASTGTIDYNNGSIDVVSGNITDTTVTLHTHTHQTTSMDTGDGSNAGSKNTSDSPDPNT